MLQDNFRNLYKKKNSTWNDSVSIYKKLIRDNIKKETIVIEAGCGFSNLFIEEYKKAKRVIGVDIKEEFLKVNSVLSEKIVADLESIPQIEDNSIDLIISSWVFEHLKSPDKVFKEFARILKKGGKIIFITPNGLNYIIILNKIIPHCFRKFIARIMNKDLVVDPMKAFYKANTVCKIGKLAELNNLKVIKIILNSDPTYVAINKLFFLIGILIEKFLNISVLKNFRVHMIGILKKI